MGHKLVHDGANKKLIEQRDKTKIRKLGFELYYRVSRENLGTTRTRVVVVLDVVVMWG
jgi:hypothetical protein